MKRRNVFFLAMWILAIMALVVSLGGCDNGTTDVDKKGKGPSTPTLDNLPDFPVGSNPGTEGSVDDILDELANSGILSSLTYKADNLLWDRKWDLDDHKGKDDTIIISDYEKEGFILNGRFSSDMQMSKNIEEIFYLVMSSMSFDFDDDFSMTDLDENTIKELMKISLKTSDYLRESRNETMWWETTEDNVRNSVKVLEGFSYSEVNSDESKTSVAQAGNFTIAKLNFSESDVSSVAAGLTVNTSKGSAKIIFNMKSTFSMTVKNISLEDLFEENFDEDDFKLSYSGSLKVYGSGDSLVKEVTIKDSQTAKDALTLLGLESLMY